ncbi:MAG: PD-(D/E)XK nuclease family protein [Flavobacteriales bacterium]
MKPFLEKIADRLILKFPDNMEKVAVVLPSKRSVVFLKYYLSQKISKPIFLPRFYSIEEFVENISGLNVIDNVSLQFYLYESYLNELGEGKDDFNEFLNWSAILLQDFNEVDTNIVDANSLYKNIKNVKELENWSVDNWSFSEKNLSDIQNNYVEFFSSMYDIYNNFRDSLINKRYAYQGLANLIASEKIHDTDFNFDKIWFVGLNALTKSQHIVIDNLKQRDIARVFWDADKYYLDNPDHEASFFLKQQKDKWREIDFEGIGDYLSHPKQKFQIVSCPQNIAQAHVMAKELSLLDSSELNNSNTAIILADEALLFPVLNYMPNQVDKLNVTMGSPFKNSPFYSFINSFLLLKFNIRKYSKGKFYYKDLLQFIEDPYFKKIIDYNQIRALRNYLKENNIVFVDSKEIYSFLDVEIFKDVFEIGSDVKKIIIQLKLIVSLLREVLAENKANIDSEVLIVFNNCLSVIENLNSEFSHKLDLKTFINLINQVVSREIIPFKGEPLEGVQLMGILESRTLDFKNVIILGVNEGIIPKGKNFNSFIPYELKKFYKIPTHTEKDAVFSYHFYRILQRAENITLTYNSKLDNFGFGEKSRFIIQLLSEFKASKIDEFIFQDNDFQANISNDIIVQNKNLVPEILKWAKRGVSPSALNKYKNCPLDFYYNYLAQIREHLEVDEFADNSLMGNAIHAILEEVLPSGNVTSKLLEIAKKDIPLRLKMFYKDALSESNFKEGKNYLSLKVAEKLIYDLINFEKKITEKNTIDIFAKEQKLTHSININGIDFNLTGIVDRVDFYNGTLRIIDYKSGKSLVKNELHFNNLKDLFENPKKDKAFQLLMYAYLFLTNHPQFLNRNINVGIYSLRNIEDGLEILSSDSELIFNEEFLSNFEQHLQILIKKIIENDFTVGENSDSCKYCSHLELFI